MPGGRGTLQTAGVAALREPTAPPAGQTQEREDPEHGRMDKDSEMARQVVQIRLIIYLSTCPGLAILQCGKSCRSSFRQDHEGWTRKTFRGRNFTFDIRGIA